MHQERLIIIDEELVELDPVIRMERRDPIRISRDFSYFALHAHAPFHDALV